MGAVAALCLVSAAHAYSLSAFFSYAGFLAVELGWSVDLDHSGATVGVLGTVIPAARIPVSFAWGIAMDRFGRKPCLIVTSLSLGIGQAIFPFCTLWWPAVTVRFVLLGMGCGWVTLMAVCCSELADGVVVTQAQLLGYAIGAGSLINMLGPGIGGVTYGALGTTHSYPALIPCLSGSVLSATAAVVVATSFPETRPPRPPPATPLSSTAQAVQPADEVNELGGAKAGAAASHVHAASPAMPASVNCHADEPLHRVLRTRPLPLLTCLRCVLGFWGFVMMALIPLWGIASVEVGGLELDNYWLGYLMSASGACGLLYTTFVMARVMQRWGVRATMVASSVLQTVLLLVLPRCQHAPFALIVVLQAAVQMANQTCFTSTITAVNHVCSRFPHRRGAINGVTVTIESAAKALGPALGGTLYSWALAQPVPASLPNASVLYFAAYALLLGLFTLGAKALPSSINAPFSPPRAAETEIATVPAEDACKCASHDGRTSSGGAARMRERFRVRWGAGGGTRGLSGRAQGFQLLHAT